MNEELVIEIRGVATELVDACNEAKEAVSGVADESDNAEKKSKVNWKAIGAAVAAGAAAVATACAKIGQAVVSNYADYEQLTGGIETLFDDSADIVMGYAENAYKTAGLSANEYMENVTGFSASLIASLDGDTAAAAEKANMAITDMSDNANKMGSSMESITNAYQGFAKQNYTMLDNLKLGYGGTKEEMQRLLEDAEKISGFKYDISSYSDIVDAIHIVQTEMGITGTTQLEAEKTISGSIGALKGAYQNFLTGLGDANADIGKLTDEVIQCFLNVFNNVKPILENIVAALPQVLDTVGEALLELAPTLMESVAELFNGILNGVIGLLPDLITIIIDNLLTLIIDNVPTLLEAVISAVLEIIQALLDCLPDLLDTFLTLILSCVDAIVQAVPQIIAALPQIITAILDFLVEAIPSIIQAGIQLFTALVNALPEIITTICEVLPQIIDAVINAIIELLPLIIDCGIQLFTALIDNLPTIIETIITAAPQIISSIVSALAENFPKIVTAGLNLFISLIKNQVQFIKVIVTAVPKILSAILKGIADGVKDMASAGVDLVKGLWNGLSSSVEWIKNKIKGWVGNVTSFIKRLFGIASPSKVFAGYGKFLSMGLAVGMEDTVGYVTNAVADTAAAIENAFNPDLSIAEADIDTSLLNKANLGTIGADLTVDNNTGWIDILIDKLYEREGGTQITLTVDGKALAQTSIKAINNLTKQTGSLGLVLA